jgi:nucleoside-diphosphate-sugar epimerase
MVDFHELADKRVFITGGTGFIGGHLLERLSQLGARLFAVSRGQPPEPSDGIQWYQGDMADLASTTILLRSIKPDIVFHLASHVAGTRSTDVIVPTFQCNLMSTVNLLTVSQSIGCRRFVLPGSLEEPSSGSAEVVPSSPYAVTKWASSAYARMFHALYQFPTVILRVFMVYGPAQRDLRKLIPYVIDALLKGDVPKLTSGQRPVDWIYVDDVVDALLASAIAENIEGKTIDIGSGRGETVRAVTEKLVRFAGSDIAPHYGAKPDRPLEQVRVADTNIAEELLGWTPRVSLDEGLKRTIAWYEQDLETAASRDTVQIS